ncbi:CHAT domain-containing protein [Pinibacter soli]|uniref:CHAT domain-containing protein n=1 Tax=Pinibacter soli TaxID=3044211 RepID=A0ABT6R9D0_9BACT|nr:CHAT domain-containing protein [Pinibacter soli]MDI3319167.1 CHAT domain-containing protein [Pinibacter soli]
MKQRYCLFSILYVANAQRIIARIRFFVCIFLLLTISSSLSAQCPDKDVLFKRVLYVRDSVKGYSEGCMKELLQYKTSINKCVYKEDTTHANLLLTLGLMYSRRGDFLNAVSSTKQSIAIGRLPKNKSAFANEMLVLDYIYLIRYYDSLHLPIEMKYATDSCLSIVAKEEVQTPYVFRVLFNAADHAFDIGDYHGCLNYVRYGEVIQKSYNSPYLASFLPVWKGLSLMNLGRYDEAENILLQFVEMHSTKESQALLPYVWGNLGQLYARRGDVKQSLYYFNKALDEARKSKYEDVKYASALDNIAFEVYYNKTREYDKALALYQQSINTFKNIKKIDEQTRVFEIFNILGNVANIYVKKGDFGNAMKTFQRAFDLLEPGGSEKMLLQMPLANVQVKYLTGFVIDMGDAWLAKYKATGAMPDLEKAISVYHTTDRFFDRLKIEQSDVQSKLFWRESSHRLYEHAIEACNLSHNAEAAFYFFEKSRANLLNDQIKELDAIGKKDVVKFMQLKRNIVMLERILKDISADSAQYRDYQNQLFDNKKMLEKMQDNIREHNKNYSQSLVDSVFITLKDVQGRFLENDQSLLEVFSGDSAVYVLHVSKTEKNLYKIDKKQYDKLTLCFLQYCDDADKLNRFFGAFEKCANDLYKLIAGTSKFKSRLIVSPGDNFFPFEALITSYSGSSVKYMIEDHAISYTYSAKFLMNNKVKDNAVGNTAQFMGMAPVTYPAGMHLPPLQKSDASLDNISDYFSSPAVYVTNKASRQQFLDDFSQYQIIQLYTHAADSSAIGEPVIYFADSALYLSDIIAGNTMNTNFIVLSACQTGTGRLYRGEGVFSFNRAFAAVGIPSSLTNLWSVNNESTYQLTELMYKYLAQGFPKDVALQKAKLEFMKKASKERTLPYYWAAPVLVGTVDPVVAGGGSYWKYLLGGTLLIIAIGGGMYMRKRKARR